MRFLPYLRETPATEDWSQSQATSFIVTTYLILAAHTFLLSYAVINFV